MWLGGRNTYNRGDCFMDKMIIVYIGWASRSYPADRIIADDRPNEVTINWDSTVSNFIAHVQWCHTLNLDTF